MFRNICYLITLTIACSLGAMEFDVIDIGTLHTRSSQAIAINNQGQILGWYDVDGTEGKHVFLRDVDGSFHEIIEDPASVYENVLEQHQSIKIDWRYLTDGGEAYGTLTLPNENPILFKWDQHNGIVNLGKMPGKEVRAINNSGQVLIRYVEEADLRYPVIWENGNVTKLKIPARTREKYEIKSCEGFDMNNKGEVVGGFHYKTKRHPKLIKKGPVKWVNGEAIKINHVSFSERNKPATAINDLGDIILYNWFFHRSDSDGHDKFIRAKNRENIILSSYYFSYFSTYDFINPGFRLQDREGNIYEILPKSFSNADCIWKNIDRIVGMDNNCHILAQGTTISGEKHIMLLMPVNQN